MKSNLRGHLVSLFCMGLLAVACGQELYHDLTETQANDIVSMLLSHGIDATKEQKRGSSGQNRWVVTIPGHAMERAWMLDVVMVPKVIPLDASISV